MSGLIGVFCSAMIYAFTQRDLWSLEQTLVRFTLTSSLLGTTTILLSVLLMQWFTDSQAAEAILVEVGRSLIRIVIACSLTKMLFDLSLLRHLWDSRMTSLKRSALLVCGPLLSVALARIGLGVFGGIAMPAMLLHHLEDAKQLLEDPVIATAICLTWMGCVGGELLERYLFFAAVSSPRMPGGVRP